jgi:hypothetical protein
VHLDGLPIDSLEARSSWGSGRTLREPRARLRIVLGSDRRVAAFPFSRYLKPGPSKGTDVLARGRGQGFSTGLRPRPHGLTVKSRWRLHPQRGPHVAKWRHNESALRGNHAERSIGGIITGAPSNLLTVPHRASLAGLSPACRSPDLPPGCLRWLPDVTSGEVATCLMPVKVQRRGDHDSAYHLSVCS